MKVMRRYLGALNTTYVYLHPNSYYLIVYSDFGSLLLVINYYY